MCSALQREIRARKEAEDEKTFLQQRLNEEHKHVTQLESERARLDSDLHVERETRRKLV